MAVPMAQNGKEEARAVAAGSCMALVRLKDMGQFIRIDLSIGYVYIIIYI